MHYVDMVTLLFALKQHDIHMVLFAFWQCMLFHVSRIAMVLSYHEASYDNRRNRVIFVHVTIS